jgi:ubiquinone/menaquinone biosynthesis C-methylase UbiE
MVRRDWDRIYKQKGEVQKEVLPNVKKAVIIFKKRKYKKILDLACGTGRHTIYLASNGFSVYGIDVSRKGIEITKRKAQKYGLKNIKLKVHDMKEIPFPDNFFDAVLCVWSMGHGTLKVHEKIVQEVRRVLKPGGMIITDFMSTKNRYYRKGREIEKNTFVGEVEGEEDVPHHYFTKDEIKKLFSKFSKLKINQVKYPFSDTAGKKGMIDAFGVEAEK